MMKKITTALLSMLVVASTFTMVFPILSNDVNAQPDQYYQDDRFMKDYGYEEEPYGYDDSRSGYDDYTYKDTHKKKDLNLYKESSLPATITAIEGPRTVSAECDPGDLYISGGFKTDIEVADADVKIDQLDSVPDLVNQEHDVTFDLLGETNSPAATFQALVVCLDTN